MGQISVRTTFWRTIEVVLHHRTILWLKWWPTEPFWESKTSILHQPRPNRVRTDWGAELKRSKFSNQIRICWFGVKATVLEFQKWSTVQKSVSTDRIQLEKLSWYRSVEKFQPIKLWNPICKRNLYATWTNIFTIFVKSVSHPFFETRF